LSLSPPLSPLGLPSSLPSLSLFPFSLHSLLSPFLTLAPSTPSACPTTLPLTSSSRGESVPNDGRWLISIRWGFSLLSSITSTPRISKQWEPEMVARER